MLHEQTITIGRSAADKIQGFIDAGPGLDDSAYQGSNNAISYTANFGDGFEIDVKCCGCDDEGSWAEAVLFENGHEVCCTEPEYTFLGVWEIEFGGNTYRVNVAAKGDD